MWRETLLITAGSQRLVISIHSLRVEGDHKLLFFLIPVRIFQSTPSVWRETSVTAAIAATTIISIHSLRVEGDVFSKYSMDAPHRISIHSLRVEGDVLAI